MGGDAPLTNIECIEFDMRKFICHFNYPAKIAPAIRPQRCKRLNGHVPFACSGAQIKNFDLALRRTPSQNVSDRTDVVVTQKFFEQIVLKIHSLYASH